MSTSKRKFVITPRVTEVIDVDTTPEGVLEAAARAEKVFLQGMQRSTGNPTIKQVVLLLCNFIKSALVGELCFDIEEEEIEEILDVLLYHPGYTFSPDFPFTKEQIIADMDED